MGKRLYVGNLPYSITEDDLTAALEESGGSVKDLHVVIDRDTGRPKGFAFAEMASDAEAEKVIQALDGKEIDGRNLTVNEARPRPVRGGQGGGGDRW